MLRIACGLAAVAFVLSAASAGAQPAAGTRNVDPVARLPLGGDAGAVHFEQDPERPFAYVARSGGVAVVSVAHPSAPRVVASIPTSSPVVDLTTVVTASGRRLLALAGPDVVAWIGVDDPSKPVDRGTTPVAGVRSLFGYHRSDGGRIVFAAAGDEVVVLDPERPGAPVSRIAMPASSRGAGRVVHHAYAAYHADSGSDRVYLAGTGGYAIYDVTLPDSARLVTFVQPATVEVGRAVQTTPAGDHIVTTAPYRGAPLRIFDLRPALEGETSSVRTDVGAWTANWKGAVEDFEVRWPYLFAAAGPDGFHMVNLRNPLEPYTTASWRTGDGPGAVSLDVRDADGLVVVSDARSGLWLLRVEDFRGWDGRGWGVPDLDAAQRWDRLPVHSDRW